MIRVEILAHTNREKQPGHVNATEPDCDRIWLVEIVFSSFKRRFGDSVMIRTMKNVINEIGIKVRIYNKLRDVAREAVLMA